MPVCFSEEFLYDGSKGCVSEKLFAIADGVIHLKGGHAYQDNPPAVDGLPVSRDSTTDETVSPSAVVETRSVQTHAPQPKQQKNGSWGVYRYYFAAAGLWTSAFLPDRSWSRPFAGNSRVSCSPIPLSPLGCPFPIRLTRRSVVAQLVVFRQRPESQSAHGQVLWRLCGSLDWIAFGTHPGMPVGYHVWGTPNRRTGLTADREQSTCHLHDIQLGNETSFGSSAHGDKVRSQPCKPERSH